MKQFHYQSMGTLSHFVVVMIPCAVIGRILLDVHFLVALPAMIVTFVVVDWCYRSFWSLLGWPVAEPKHEAQPHALTPLDFVAASTPSVVEDSSPSFELSQSLIESPAPNSTPFDPNRRPDH